MADTHAYQVTGMTCAHCVDAVTHQVGQLPGVRAVDVDLDTGRVVVTSEVPLADSAVAAAIDEAGYEVVGVDAQPL